MQIRAPEQTALAKAKKAKYVWGQRCRNVNIELEVNNEEENKGANEEENKGAKLVGYICR